MLNRKMTLTLMLLMMLSVLVFVNFADSQVTRTTIFIEPDGSVNPATVPILRNGDVYTFTDNVYDPILVQKSNITLDGNGYSLIGPLTPSQKEAEQILGLGPNTTIQVPYIIGIDCDKTVHGVTFKNINITSFSIGAYIRTTHNALIDNGVSDCIVGVLLSGSANNITMNYVANNKQGLFFGFEQVNGSSFNIPSDIKISDNSFINNSMQLSGCVCKIYNFTEQRHAWDYNGRGNYWSDYNGTDSNGDGIGDTFYIIDLLNYDQYPLVQSPAQLPTPPLQFPVTLVIIAAVIAIAVIAALVAVRRRANRHMVL